MWTDLHNLPEGPHTPNRKETNQEKSKDQQTEEETIKNSLKLLRLIFQTGTHFVFHFYRQYELHERTTKIGARYRVRNMWTYLHNLSEGPHTYLIIHRPEVTLAELLIWTVGLVAHHLPPSCVGYSQFDSWLRPKHDRLIHNYLKIESNTHITIAPLVGKG